MALLNNPYIIDIIIGLFLIIYTFIGYLKGFIIRLYDFFSLFIAYFLTINFSFPLSKLIILYQLEGLLEPIGIKVNQLLVAVILFIVIYFLLKGIGVLLKPFLKKIVSFLKMTKLLDRLLGLILSIIEGIIIVYFVISMIFIPFINQGKETIEQTYIGSFIIDTMPHYFSSIADFKDFVAPEVEEEEVYIIVEQMPGFPGGEEALLKYISDHIEYPTMAVERGIEGRVTVRFVVNKDGYVQDVTVIRGVHELLDKEAVRVYYNVPVNFTLQ